MTKQTSKSDELVRLSVLEHTVIKQNESVDGRLGNIEGALREIHNKMDSHILGQAVAVTKLQGEQATLTKEIERVDGKITRTSSGIALFAAAIFTGAWEWFKK